MTVSERFREITRDVKNFTDELQRQRGDELGGARRSLDKGLAALEELRESVGEIPRIRLESELTPVLLKAHSFLDRARFLLLEDGLPDLASSLWEIEQKIYRLLNEL